MRAWETRRKCQEECTRGYSKSLRLRDELYACAIALLLSILVPRTLQSTTRTCHALHSEWRWSFVIGTGLAGVTLSTVSELRQVAEYYP